MVVQMAPKQVNPAMPNSAWKYFVVVVAQE